MKRIEPLRDKEFTCVCNLPEKVFPKEDLQAAIEHFKQEINSLPKEITRKQLEIQIWHILPISFEDAYKVEE